MISRIFGLLLAPAIVSATSLEYYRSAFCDGQNSSFFLSKYTVAEPLSNDNVCHQAPSRSMAIKLVDGLDPSCIGMFSTVDGLRWRVIADGKQCLRMMTMRAPIWLEQSRQTANVLQQPRQRSDRGPCAAVPVSVTACPPRTQPTPRASSSEGANNVFQPLET